MGSVSRAVVVSGVRTPIGRYGGALAGERPDDLAALVIAEAVARSRVDANEIEDVYFGWSNQAGEDNRNVAREDQDAFALASQKRWAAAAEAGRFDDELVPVAGVTRDEHPRPDTTLEKLAALEPAFRDGGTVTAGNASGINDGAAALVIASEERARDLGVEPLGAFVGSAVAGVDPRVMGIGPVPAVRKLLARAGVDVSDVDLVELNEAFASQSLVVIRELGLDHAKVNVNGGAIAIGHPLGMSGARLVVSLLHELRRRGGRYGLATLCVRVGQGQAALFER